MDRDRVEWCCVSRSVRSLAGIMKTSSLVLKDTRFFRQTGLGLTEQCLVAVDATSRLVLVDIGREMRFEDLCIRVNGEDLQSL